ncbi:DUF5684 domain-containing protein [uncultured Fusobacterium sp.]|uniref:DUF5684 domain-containing protein n=1 Tax=uncultured Fusobacterium sp. TaxID=159267 RepID=UPI0026602D45|nr:DUF5684 domain-containing protein [uncultured Fusobacterium sp.]
MLSFVLYVLLIIGMWRIFEKAGVAGWKSLIPFYNIYVLITKIINKPWWWFILIFIPGVNVIVAFLINIALARAFGKGFLFGVGLALLGFIFYLILGFGDIAYQGPIEVEVIDSEEKRDYDL